MAKSNVTVTVQDLGSHGYVFEVEEKDTGRHVADGCCDKSDDLKAEIGKAIESAGWSVDSKGNLTR